MPSRRTFLNLVGLAALPLGARAQSTAPLRPDMAAFAADVAARNGLDGARVGATLQEAQVLPAVLQAFSTPGTARPWREFRAGYLNRRRIDGGVNFWEANRTVLERVGAAYAVPEEVMVAIIGVETFYGRVTGGYRVLDALVTLAFEADRRVEFFRGELEQFLVLALSGVLDHAAVKGSYAGAMGWPQFMPSSVRRFAVDFDADGRIDLWSSPSDILGSVGNYFRVHGWKTGRDVVLRATVRDEAAIADLVAAGVQPSAGQDRLEAAGVTPERPLAPDETASLMRFEGEQGPEYWLGLDNFYVITRYNRSQNYALAVWQLATAIQEARGRRATA